MPAANLILEDVRIKYRNFSGAPDRFNPRGVRPNFFVVLSEEQAHQLENEGWRIRWIRDRETEEITDCLLKVIVNFDTSRIPPTIMTVSERGKRYLTSETMKALDYAEIKSVDLVVNPYRRQDAVATDPYSAYLKTMAVTVYEDPILSKYQNATDLSAEEEDIPF